MINLETIIYSLRKLWHSKSRSFLTIFSILIGIAAIFIFVSFGYGLYNYADELVRGTSADKVLITPKGAGIPGLSDFVLDEDDLKAVERTLGVYDVVGVSFDTVEVKKGDKILYTFLISGDAKKLVMYLESFNIGLEKGRFIQPGDDGKALLGYNYLVAGRIFDKPLDVNDKIEVNGESMRVVGFLDEIGNPQDDSQIYVTRDYFLELFPDGDNYNQIIASVDVEDIDGVVSGIEKSLRKSRDLEEGKEDFFVASFQDFLEDFMMVLNIIVGFVVLIAFISVIVSAINTANTMITSVLERYKEIGVLKAIGAKRSVIFGIFLFESGFLGFVAGVLGILLGFGITSIAGSIIMSLGWGFLQPAYPLELFIGLILFSVLTGVISGIIPTIKASRINVVDSLRYE